MNYDNSSMNGGISNMSEDQIKQWFSNDMKEIKDSIKELTKILTNLRLELAEDYVKKNEYSSQMLELHNKYNEFNNKIYETKEGIEKEYEKKLEEHKQEINKQKQEERNYNLKVLGLGFTGFTIVFGLFQWVLSVAGK